MGSDGDRRRPQWRNEPATKGLTVRHRTTGYVGQIVRFSPTQVVIRDKAGREHQLPLAPGAFSVGGRNVTLVRPKPQPRSTEPAFSASGSIMPERREARVAAASRIMVEGLHDAELVEKIWGDDLRQEGVVVEPLHGADDLAAVVSAFAPTPERRLGILLDHLIADTKESKIARRAIEVAGPDAVLITGHDFIDIWAAVKPSVVGIEGWPDVPMGIDWKEGVRSSLGFEGPTGALWKVILSRVKSFRDLDPSLVGAVEQLIDFVAPPPTDEVG